MFVPLALIGASVSHVLCNLSNTLQMSTQQLPQLPGATFFKVHGTQSMIYAFNLGLF